MATDLEMTQTEMEDEETAATQDEPRRQTERYEAEIEPLVTAAIPEMREEYRGWLGWLKDLIPSHKEDETHFPPDDRLWLQALAAVCHRHGLTYELVADPAGRQLWLIPPPVAH
jgi:hypothetical protein